MHPFDQLAADYDASFTDTHIGRLMRDAVWRHTDAAFPPGSHVLELNCGTGVDAQHLAQRGVTVVATDASEHMLARAQRRLAGRPEAARVHFESLEIEHVDQLAAAGFTGVLSNFGGMNCVEDLTIVSRRLADKTVAGATVVLVIMGPLVPWEWVWFGARGDFTRAIRRIGRAGTEWRGMRVRYPSLGAVRRAFLPQFAYGGAVPIGALLPPPYAASLARRWPAMVNGLNRIERRMERFPGLVRLADHYLCRFRRRPDETITTPRAAALGAE